MDPLIEQPDQSSVFTSMIKIVLYCKQYGPLNRATWSEFSVYFNDQNSTVNPLYNDTVCSKLSLTLKWICCYKEILTITRFQHNNHLVKENIVQMIKNFIIANVYISWFSSISYCIKMHKASHLSSETETCSCKTTLFWSQNCLAHGKNSVIMNLFLIEIVFLFPEVAVGVVKWIFCNKEGILMETDPFPAILCRILNILF